MTRNRVVAPPGGGGGGISLRWNHWSIFYLCHLTFSKYCGSVNGWGRFYCFEWNLPLGQGKFGKLWRRQDFINAG